MDLTIILVVFVICLCASSQKISYFVNQSKTFDEAQQYCREHYIDLLSQSHLADVAELFIKENFIYIKSAWIGLRREGSKKWRWALDDEEFYKEGEKEYRNWAPGEQQFLVEFKDCTVMASNGQFYDIFCVVNQYFICYNVLKKRQMLRIEIKSPQHMSDTLQESAILIKLKQIMEDLGMENSTNLTLRMLSNGLV